MSARELINQVAALPTPERILFEQLYREMGTKDRDSVPADSSAWPDFADRLDAIYGDNTAPDSQAIIDEGRGEQ